MKTLKDNRDMDEMERYYVARIEALRGDIKQKDALIEKLRDDVHYAERQLGQVLAQMAC